MNYCELEEGLYITGKRFQMVKLCEFWDNGAGASALFWRYVPLNSVCFVLVRSSPFGVGLG